MDVALKYNAGIKQFDLAIEDGDLAAEAGLETAVIISLFTDRRALANDNLPDGTNDRRGYWVDVYNDQPLGSRLWLLFREKEQDEVLRRAKVYAEEALGRYMIYAWRAVSQFSAFGVTPSNGLVDGPFWPMDFLPRLAMLRNYTMGGNTYDHFVLGYGESRNPVTRYLMTNLPVSERQSAVMDFNANGIKIRGNSATVNPAGSALIPYAAWAQTPGKFARAR